MIRFSSCLLLIGALVISSMALAQTAPAPKYRVYSDYLTAAIAALDAPMDIHIAGDEDDTTSVPAHKTQSIVLQPSNAHDAEVLADVTAMVRAYTHRVPPHTPATYTPEAAARYLGFWPWGLKAWLDADPANGALYLRLDSLLRHPQPLRPAFTLPCRVVLGKSRRQLLGRQDDWARFYRRYPGSYGIVRLSDVAFSADQRRAVLLVAESQGGLAGGGSVVSMVLGPAGWRVEALFNIWVS